MPASKVSAYLQHLQEKNSPTTTISSRALDRRRRRAAQIQATLEPAKPVLIPVESQSSTERTVSSNSSASSEEQAMSRRSSQESLQTAGSYNSQDDSPTRRQVTPEIAASWMAQVGREEVPFDERTLFVEDDSHHDDEETHNNRTTSTHTHR